jgi:hypothetical protein
MNPTVAWSYQLLGPNEPRVFRHLGVLAGRFPIEAAAAVVAGREGTSARSDEALGAAAGALTWLIDRDRPTEACDIAWVCSSSGPSVGTRPRGSTGMNRS